MQYFSVFENESSHCSWFGKYESLGNKNITFADK
jgi:hypothetical protein